MADRSRLQKERLERILHEHVDRMIAARQRPNERSRQENVSEMIKPDEKDVHA